MATRTTSLAPDNNTDANFRAWINEVHNSLIAFGWVQTSDTGQINFATVTRPASAGTYQGYAMYRMGDSLQSSAPVFLRLDFGTWSAITDAPSMKYQVGIGTTDGAGNITGTASNYQAQVTLSNNQASVTAVNVRTCGSSSSFYMSFWNVNGLGFCLCIERCKDSSGADTTDGVCVISFYIGVSSVISLQSQFIPRLPLASFIAYPADTTWWALLSSQSSQSAGGNIGVSPVRTQGGYLRMPMLGVMVFSRADFTMETTFTVTMYGASHTYLALRPRNSGVSVMQTVNADPGFAILWE